MDGVLCNLRACLAVSNNGMFSYPDPIACLLVKRLLVECNAKLVISSSWRNHYTKTAFEAILNAACPLLGDFIWDNDTHWRTTSISYPSHDEQDVTSDRGREISHWVYHDRDKIGTFCILDDMADMRPVQKHLVKCDTYDGIGFNQYCQAEKLLTAFNKETPEGQ